MFEKKLEDPSYLTLWALSILVPFERFRRRRILFWLTVLSVLAGYVFLAIWKLEGMEGMESLIVRYFAPLIFMIVAITVTMFAILLALIWPFATSFGIVVPIAMIVGGIGILGYELYGYLSTGSWNGLFIADLWSGSDRAALTADNEGSLALLAHALGWTPAFVALIFGGILWITTGEDKVKKMGGQLVEEYKELRATREELY